MVDPEIVYKESSRPATPSLAAGQGQTNKATLDFMIRTICPVHLGCDDVYDPLSFTLDPETSELIVFDPSEFLGGLSDGELKKFSDICKEGTLSSIIKIYKFMRNQRPLGRRVGVCSGFLAHYDKALSIPERDQGRIQQELNRFIINRTAYLPTTDRPYIPGSAIKGSIRTAYLNLLAAQRKVNPERGKGKDLEKQLLDGGAFATDPFRLLKVSDFMPVGEIKTKIVYAVNEKKKQSIHEARGPYQILETIEPGSLFVGTITLEQPGQGAGIKTPLKIKNVMDSLKSFYTKEKNSENKALQDVNIPTDPMPANEGTILRLGRHSGAESVTIDGYRDIRIMLGGGKSKFLTHSTTMWLSSEYDNPKSKNTLRAFGWATLTQITADQKSELLEKEASWRTGNADQRTVVLQRIQDRMSRVARNEAKPIASKASVQTASQPEKWLGATLTWHPGPGEIVAQLGTKKASTKDRGLVPETMKKKLFDKKKPVAANVEVISFKIIRIE
ncbi:MAG: type III-A CRISPR-associated RAMP protein Csm5 [Desulfomonilaceae bacterium]